MTFIDTVADLLIVIDEPKHRDRTMPKRDRNHKGLPPSNELRLINEQIQMSVGSLGTPTHNRHKPSGFERINSPQTLSKKWGQVTLRFRCL